MRALAKRLSTSRYGVLMQFIGAAWLFVTLARAEPWPSELSDRRCRTNPKRVSQCFTIHARLSAYNGSPGLRLWPVGSRRLLGVLPAEDAITPDCLLGNVGFDTNLYGDYTVCPFTLERTGHMHMVCIEKAQPLLQEKEAGPTTPPRYTRLRGCSLEGRPAH